MKVLMIVPFLLCILISCREKSIIDTGQVEDPQRTYYNVDQRLWPYFNNFEDEARARGIDVDLTRANITGELIQIHEEGVVGSCSYGGRVRNAEVSIDQNFWNRVSNAYREYIVFHELGHCYLFRNHREACRSNGTWASLMRSGTLNTCRDYYNGQTREYYLDELFGLLSN